MPRKKDPGKDTAAAAKEKKPKKKKEPGKRGPKAKFNDDKIMAARYMAMAGLTDVQIAKGLGIATSTLYVWAKKYPELSEALKGGKFIADGKVVGSLYQKATGYEYEEITTQSVKVKKADGTEEETPAVEIKRVRKTVAPDTTAAIFWLLNRQPDTWRNVKEIKHSGNIGGENGEIEKQLENDPESRELLKELYKRRGSMGDLSQD